MATSMLYRLSAAISNLENSIASALSRLFPPGGPAVAIVGVNSSHPHYHVEPLQDDLKSRSILAAVPRGRRSVERRMERRFGWRSQYWKMLWYKKNLQSCLHCGNWHEPGRLCPSCYNITMKETIEIKRKIEEVLKLDPVDKEVVVLYEDDIKAEEEFYEGMRIVEMEKPRPVWFSKNLMQPSTQEPNETVKDVKPANLS